VPVHIVRNIPRHDSLTAMNPGPQMVPTLFGNGRTWTGDPLTPVRGSAVIPAQGVFFVRACCSPTCGLFTVRHGVWSPTGPQAGSQIRAVDAQVSMGEIRREAAQPAPS
jgi:hypothetical protein